MRRLVTILVVLLLASPAAAAMRDGWVGDVAVVAWLEGEVVKVALANGGSSRVTLTLASDGWDQGWRPFFLDRTIVVPARTVVIEAFDLSSSWRGEPIAVRVSAWDREAVVAVQTSEIFSPAAYVVRAQEGVRVFVDLAFLVRDLDTAHLVVDEVYRGFGQGDVGEIAVEAVEGGFYFSPARRQVEWMDPYMILSMRAPKPQRGVTTFSFNVYKVQTDAFSYHEEEITGPSILVYDRNLAYQDNSHLSPPPTPPWNWRP
ncbi:MAG: hypothetical protein ACOX46_10315 [Limnochordia bacterium]|nr:hypothetical protein [Bacillota bacterium]HBG10620.1 hypothetical protein [Bacillota bacterium]HOA36483.1 hypothetical protein [Bacillota bacterium]